MTLLMNQSAQNPSPLNLSSNHCQKSKWKIWFTRRPLPSILSMLDSWYGKSIIHNWCSVSILCLIYWVCEFFFFPFLVIYFFDFFKTKMITISLKVAVGRWYHVKYQYAIGCESSSCILVLSALHHLLGGFPDYLSTTQFVVIGLYVKNLWGHFFFDLW